jgi:superfamily II DNA/RNA helicase
MTSPSSSALSRPRTQSRRSRGRRRTPANGFAPSGAGPRTPQATPRTAATAAPRPATTAPASTARPSSVSGTGFAGLGLSAAVVGALATAGITTPTPIQEVALPDALAGRDVLGRARTGSGKTLAFGLPLLSRLAGEAPRRVPNRPRGLILLPTRELAQQVEDALRPIADVLGQRLLVVVGGAPIGRQITGLGRGVDVLVATPGRLEDLLQRRAVSLDAVSTVVLDEADHMADLGFLPAVRRILDSTPSGRQCLLFSATLDGDVDKLVSRYLRNPAVHRVDEDETPTAAMEHRVFRLSHEHKIAVAAEIADRQDRTLFFVRTKHGADRLARQFRSRGVDATALHGNLNQNQRRRALDAFTSGRTPVLVATDVAARGLHVDALGLVVHFDPPTDHKVYAHRSGRTARAGASGTVISLVEPHQQADVTRIHRLAKIDAQTSTVRPGDRALREVASEQ